MTSRSRSRPGWLAVAVLVAAAAAATWWLLRDSGSHGEPAPVTTALAPTDARPAPPDPERPAPAASPGAARARVRVSGRVVDADGGPVPEAELLLEGPNDAAAATTTDARGQFSAELPLVGLYRATVTAPGFAGARFDDLPADTDVLLHLARDVVLAGGVEYISGGAVEHYSLELRPVSVEVTSAARPSAAAPGSAVRYAPAAATVSTRPRHLEVNDAEGRFELDGLAPGTYRLSAHAEDGASGELSVNLGPTGQRGVLLRLLRGGTVRGLAVDEETGEPLAGVEVALRRGKAGPSGRSGEDGVFEVKGVVAGVYNLTARLRGYRELQRWDLNVEAGGVLQLEDLQLSRREGRQGPQVRFGGIGARLGGKQGRVTIVAVEPGGPAEREGLAAGDRILGIDGQPAQRLAPGEVARKIRGAAGRAVSLEVERDGQRLSFVLVREALEMDVPQRRRRGHGRK